MLLASAHCNSSKDRIKYRARHVRSTEYGVQAFHLLTSGQAGGQAERGDREERTGRVVGDTQHAERNLCAVSCFCLRPPPTAAQNEQL